MIFSSKSQMIHVISEVVVLIGFTFYFTSKLNKLSDDLVKTNQVIKSQNDRINYLENMVKYILNKVNKPVKVKTYKNTPVVQNTPDVQNTPEIKEIKETKEIQKEVTRSVVSTPIEIQEIQNNQEEIETFDTVEKTTQEENVEENVKENASSSEEDLDKELEAELAELKEEEEKLE